MNPDTDLGENARYREVSDDQTTCSFSPEFKQQAAYLVLDQGYSYTEVSRSMSVGESVLRPGCSSFNWNAKASRRGAALSKYCFARVHRHRV